MASKRDPRLALNGSRASVEPEVASSGVASGAARKRSSLAGRRCALCPLGHEAVPVLGPLLQFDLNRKKATVLVHQLCALWAPKAHHSTDPGAQNGFMNVPAEVQRASKLSCKLCKSKGAAMGCKVSTCRKTFHLPCAMIEADYEFNTTRWQVYCSDHRINERGVEGQEMVLLRRELRALALETKRGAPAPASPIAARAAPRQQAQQPKQEGQQGKVQQEVEQPGGTQLQQEEGRQGGAGGQEEQHVYKADDAMCLAEQQARYPAQQAQEQHEALLEQQEQIAQQQQQQEQQGLLQSPGGTRAKQCSHCGAQQAGPPGTTAYNWRRHPTSKTQLCGRCGRYADSHFGQLPPLTQHRQQQGEDHQPDHQQDEVWQQGAAEEQRQGGEVEEEEEEEGLQPAAKRPCSSLEQAANYAMDLDAVIALARALHAAPEHDAQAAVQLDAGVVWPGDGGDDAYAQQHEQQQPQQQQQGQQDLLPPAVSELVWDVFGEVAPDAVAAAESYLWAEGVRSFEDLQDCDKQDFAARVPCTKLLCNRFFRLLRERLAERGIPGDAAPH